MRPVRIIATAVFAAALAVTGCTSRTDQTTAPASSGPSSVPTTQPTAATTTNRSDTGHRQVRPLPEQRTGGISGHPFLPRVRALGAS